MNSNRNGAPVREAVGIYFDAKHLKEAIADLQREGFTRDELGLLADEHTVQQSLGDLYTRTNRDSDSADAPETAFVAKESVGDAVHGLAGGLFFAGGAVAVGAVVTSAAVLGGAVLATVGSVAAVGSLGALLGRIIHQTDAEYLQQQVDMGHLLLFVRVKDKTEERRAVKILSRHAGQEVKVIEVPAESRSDKKED